MEPIKIYILEDRIIIRELLKETLETLNYNICGTNSNAELALLEIKELKPDIVFLDIKVEGSKTGIWLGNQLDVPIIYLTAFSDTETIAEVVKTKPASYLVKPFNIKELFIALQLAIDIIAKKKEITIKVDDENINVFVEDISFVKKVDESLTLYLKDSVKLIQSNIEDFLKRLDSNSFLQVHHQYFVNKNHISKLTLKVIKIDKFKIPISQKYQKNVLKELV